MPSSSYVAIRAAMAAKKQITCSYNGYHREMCVHTIGTSAGKEMILGYQFAGESSKPPSTDDQRWRCMEVAKIENITVRDGPWKTSANHSKAQTCVKDVDFEVTG